VLHMLQSYCYCCVSIRLRVGAVKEGPQSRGCPTRPSEEVRPQIIKTDVFEIALVKFRVPRGRLHANSLDAVRRRGHWPGTANPPKVTAATRLPPQHCPMNSTVRM
jgi:hypothetical protein